MNAIQCHRARMSFELYLDGGLSLEECESLESHLLDCAACAAAVGDDVRLGEAIEESMGSGKIELRAVRQARSWKGPARAAAAAVVLLAVGVGIGNLTAGKGAPVTPPGSPGGGDPVVRAAGPVGSSDLDVLPASDLTDDPWVGLATFTDADLVDAERTALKSRGERFEWRIRRAEAAFDLMRPLLEETATPARVVERLKDRIAHSGGSVPGRPPREGGDRMWEARRHVAGAEMLLRRDPHAAVGPVTAWLETADGPVERWAAVKLLGLLRVREAHDLLAAESAKGGPIRDAALDGLVLLRDPRSRDAFRAVMDDAAAPIDPTRVKAAGGLHRLGDSRGLEFLLATFEKAAPGDSVRKRVLCHVVANPTREAVAELPKLIQNVRLDPKERGQLVELLTLSGAAETDPNLVPMLRQSPGDRDHGRVGPPPRDAQ
jgi:Putative zinc-finger